MLHIAGLRPSKTMLAPMLCFTKKMLAYCWPKKLARVLQKNAGMIPSQKKVLASIPGTGMVSSQKKDAGAKISEMRNEKKNVTVTDRLMDTFLPSPLPPCVLEFPVEGFG